MSKNNPYDFEKILKEVRKEFKKLPKWEQEYIQRKIDS